MQLEKKKEVVNVQSYTRRRRAVSTGSGEISTAEESVSTAGASMPVSTAGTVQEEDIQATIEADEELAQRIQAEEREKYSEAEKGKTACRNLSTRERDILRQHRSTICIKKGGTSH
ncbi:hypothetical protein Tco_0843466 [Tanacetum coccineum]|uniref:Uncharacterized protein n=1 Tax=Tanacetum coccineum TaxID=301880 RepID=A0ABQ5B3Y5_9ASTR